MSTHSLKLFFLCNYSLAVILLASFIDLPQLIDGRTAMFFALLVVTYAGIYLLPALLLSAAANRLLKLSGVVFGVAVFSVSATLLILVADHKLYELYGFHINAFVFNLIVTPGGVESLDVGETAKWGMMGMVAALLLVESGIARLSAMLARRPGARKIRFGVLITVLVSLSIGERLVYAVSDIQSHSGVLQVSQTFPLYSRLTIRTLASDLGLGAAHKEKGMRLARDAVTLNYPLKPIREVAPKNPLNLLWLVAESLRWDMLTPEIMPNTWSLAQQSWHLKKHYSGGNGTRQGMFSLFYGLYGSYWDAFLMAERGPVLFDLLQRQHYQMAFYTSAAFTYPEFDQTLFSQIPAEHLHQFGSGVSAVERDRRNIDRIIEWLKRRDNHRPFMTFLFLESTHARYSFPPSAIIREPYLENLNYATLSRDSLQTRSTELKNRYINASHYIDAQIGRLLEFVKRKGLLDDTVILITGDHGEEFMEQGHWGHNRGFSQQQVRTPMVLWLPGRGHKEVNGLTSHMDIIPTLLPLLGVMNPTDEYSLGADLLRGEREPFVVVSDIAGLAYLDEDYAFSLPFKSSLEQHNRLWRNGQPQDDATAFFKQHRAELNQILKNARKFTRTGVGGAEEITACGGC